MPVDGFDAVIITCEHASNQVPAAFKAAFAHRRAVLATHKAYDKGARAVAKHLARRLRSQIFCGTITRLVIDLNRSPGDQPTALLERHYWPYRRSVERAIALHVRRGERVLHLSVHSFTPVLRGVRRSADVGLLFDPKRSGEARLCRAWQPLLAAQGYRTRLNYPYVGWTDGLTTYLRTRFGARSYVGIELEMNQRLARDKKGLDRYAEALMSTLNQLNVRTTSRAAAPRSRDRAARASGGSADRALRSPARRATRTSARRPRRGRR
jgi:predicted N-formylglutamate amidohydrolase